MDQGLILVVTVVVAAVVVAVMAPPAILKREVGFWIWRRTRSRQRLRYDEMLLIKKRPVA